jgi:tape measure domain-containing protein
MADISLRIKADFAQADKAFKAMSTDSEYLQKKMNELASSSEKVSKVMSTNSEKMRLNALAVAATRGPTAGLMAEQRSLRTEIERLIKAGINPENEALSKLRNRYAEVSKQIGDTTKKTGGFGDIIKGILGANLIQSGINALASGFKGIVREAMKLEDAQAAFTPLMGGAEKATKLVQALNVAAAETPFEFDAIASATKQLLPVMEGDIQKTVATFKMLGDTAGGNAEKLDTITRGFTKAMLKGKVDMESLNMIAEAGVPIFSEMGKTMGYNKDQMGAFFKQISTGTVSTDVLIQAFKNMTSEGGIFYQGMIIASKTTSGVFSTLSDNVKMTAAGIGQALLPMIKELAISFIEISSGMLNFINNNKETIQTVITIGVKALPIAIGAWTLYTAWVSRAAIQSAIVAKWQALVSVATGVQTAVMWLATAAVKAFSMAWSMSPIGTAALVVSGVAIALGAFVKWMNEGTNSTDQHVKSMREMIYGKEKAIELMKTEKAEAQGVAEKTQEAMAAHSAGVQKQIDDLKKSGKTDAEIAAQLKANAEDVLKKRTAALAEYNKNVSIFGNAQLKYEGKKAESEVKMLMDAANNMLQVAEQAQQQKKAQQSAANSAWQSENKKFDEEYLRMVNERGKTEAQIEAMRVGDQLSQLADHYRRGIVLFEDYAKIKEAMEDAHSKKMMEIEQKQAEIRASMVLNSVQTTGSMLMDIQTLMKNTGKESRKVALALRGIAIAEAAINSYVAFTKALTLPFPMNWVQSGLVLAAGLAKQAAIISTPIPKAETGIDYTVPDTRTNRNDRAAVMASAGERVQVTPRGEDSDGTRTINIQVGQDTIFRVVQRGIDTGKINVSDRNIGRGVFA